MQDCGRSILRGRCQGGVHWRVRAAWKRFDPAGISDVVTPFRHTSDSCEVPAACRGRALREELDGKRAAEFLKAHGIIPTCGCNACARGRRLNAQQEKAAQSQTFGITA